MRQIFKPFGIRYLLCDRDFFCIEGYCMLRIINGIKMVPDGRQIPMEFQFPELYLNQVVAGAVCDEIHLLAPSLLIDRWILIKEGRNSGA